MDYSGGVFSHLDRESFRQKRNLGFAIASEIGAPFLSTFARLRCGAPTPIDSWRRGLLIGHSHIGDVLYNTGSLPYLKKALPNCYWHWLVEAPAEQVLSNNPFIDGTVTRKEIGRFLQQHKVDVALCYNYSGYPQYLWKAITLRIPNRVAYTHKGFSAWVTHPINPIPQKTPPESFRHMVAELSNCPPTWPVRPLVYPDRNDEVNAEILWNELGKPPNILAAFVTSRQRTGIVPLAKFGEILRQIQSRFSGPIVLLGASSDKENLINLKREFELNCTIQAGRLSLLELVCFLRKCRAVLSTDSGPRHLANAAGRPVVFFRNLWSSKAEVDPYCDTEIDLAPDVELLSPQEQAPYFEKICPNTVATKVLQLLTP